MVAAFEALKGSLVLAAGFGLLALMHQDLHAIGNRLVMHLHLDPASRYPQVFLHALVTASDARIWMLAAGALAYATLRFVEAYGLWRHRAWAEWLAAISGAIYLPFEVIELARGVDALKLATFVVNLAIVAYMVRALHRRRLGTRGLTPTGPP